MRNTFSLYEAKAKLSAIVRMVREGQTVVVTLHGKPVVEMRPVESRGAGIDERIDELTERGIIVHKQSENTPRAAIARRQGALARFLAGRD